MENRVHLRVFYAFDPRRSAILLIGGVKTDDKRFYRRYVRLADTFLRTLRTFLDAAGGQLKLIAMLPHDGELADRTPVAAAGA